MTVARSSRPVAVLSFVLAGLVVVVFPLVLVGFLPGLLYGNAGVDPGILMAAGLRMSAVLVVVSGGLIAVAVGLLHQSTWAPTWCARWAIVALGAVAVTALMLREALLQVASDAATHAFVGVYVALLVPFPLCLVWLFGLRRQST